MHLRHLTIGLAAALTVSAYAWSATVYKWTDSNGVVHYSDQPGPGAVRIETQSGSDTQRSAGPAAGTDRAKNTSKADDQPKGALNYRVFSIDAPMPEQNFTEPAVTVRLDLQPDLRSGQVIALYLNGKLVENQPNNATEFTLADMARGQYSLVATITDTESGETKSTPAVTFYVQRPSLLSPLRRKK